MKQGHLVMTAAGGSAALLAGALAFQHLGGLAPCELCVWQRYPHVAAIVLGAVAVAAPSPPLIAAGAAAALATAAAGAYHAGVEQGWWDGPGACSSAAIDGLDPDALFDRIMAAPLVRCDEIAWQFAGLSMAGWNMVLSAGLAALWIIALRAGPASA